MAVRVELAQDVDVPALADLYVAYRAFYKHPDPEAGTLEFMRERIMRRDSRVAVARGSSSTLGMTNTYVFPDPATLQPLFLLSDLFVDPAGRGAGIGAALMQDVEAAARAASAGHVVLRTAADNATAQSVYVKSGYRQQPEEQSPWDWPGQAEAAAADGVLCITDSESSELEQAAATLGRIHGVDDGSPLAFLQGALAHQARAVLTTSEDIVGVVCSSFGSNAKSRTYLLWTSKLEPEALAGALPRLLAAARGLVGAAEPLRLDAPGSGPVAQALRGLGASRTDAFWAFRLHL